MSRSIDDRLVEAAKACINAVFSDMNVSRETTRANLKELRDEIDMLIDALPEMEMDF